MQGWRQTTQLSAAQGVAADYTSVPSLSGIWMYMESIDTANAGNDIIECATDSFAK